MYYTENNHNKVVLRDFYLSRFENGPITEPCGTPEYLGTLLPIYLCSPFFSHFSVSPSLISSDVFPTASSGPEKIGLLAQLTFLTCSLPFYSDHILWEVNCVRIRIESSSAASSSHSSSLLKSCDLRCFVTLLVEVYERAGWSGELCFGLVLSCERSGQLFITLCLVIRQINKKWEQSPWQGRNENSSDYWRELLYFQCIGS